MSILLRQMPPRTYDTFSLAKLDKDSRAGELSQPSSLGIKCKITTSNLISNQVDFLKVLRSSTSHYAPPPPLPSAHVREKIPKRLDLTVYRVGKQDPI